MSNKNKNQLSKQIKEVLLDHEEPYVLGSWERFQRYKSRKNRIQKQRLYLAIAASVIFILMFAFSRMNIKSVPRGQVTERQSQDHSELTENSTPPFSKQENMPLAEDSVEETSGNETDATEKNSDTSLEPSTAKNFDPFTSTVSRKSLPNYTLKRTDLLTSEKTSDRIVRNLETTGTSQTDESKSDHLAGNIVVQSEDINHLLDSSQKKDLVFSIAYAPAMNVHDSQTDLGTGGGFYTGWNFARNMTLSSGIVVAQNRLKLNNRHESRLAREFSEEGPSTLSAENLTSIQIDLVNLEIPLNLRYFLTDKLSVSAGISSLALLKEKYNYNFEYEQRIQIFEENATTGLQPSSRVVKVKTTQTKSEPSPDRINWAAFYTFSVGYQQEVFKRYTASFEPFIKVPAGEVTSSGISYTSGGVQLKISF